MARFREYECKSCDYTVIVLAFMTLVMLSGCATSEERAARAAELKKKGFPVARRTVAKYRESLGIPIAKLRKR